jgi:uncharacterized protein YraI
MKISLQNKGAFPMITLQRQSRWWLRRMTLLLLLLAGAVTVSAQVPTPITIGENQTGQVVDSSVPVRYSFISAAPLSVQIQVLAISQGLAPTFRVVDPGGVVILSGVNSGDQTIVQGSPNLSSPGTYTIEVSSANGATGQFLISVQAGAPLAPPQPLTPGQPLDGAVNLQTSRQAYSFSGLEDEGLLVAVQSDDPASAPVVVLRDADTGETLALTSTRLAGVVYRISAGVSNYLVEVTHSGSSATEAFEVCLATESGSAGCPAIVGAQVVQPTALPTIAIPTQIPTLVPPPTFAPPTINPAGACQVVTRGQFVNVRSGPGTGFAVLTQLAPTAAAPVIGRLPDNSWFQINVNGVLGWVSAAVVTLGGNCSGVSVVIPPTPVISPSVIPPIATTEVSPFTATPTSTPTMTTTPSPTIVATLNFSLPPNYGSTALTSGFVPDPYSVGITSGGSVNVSYLGGGCSGFATSAPDFSLNYTSGAFPTLRFYFIGSGDTTMVINSPSASYACVDDSFGTLNPTIDFNSPSGGRYDIWIGSYAPGTSISGTLYVTENTGNHP